MLRTLLLTTIAVALFGCAIHTETTGRSAVGHYRPKNSDGKQWDIQFVRTTTIDRGWSPTTQKLHIDLYINGELVETPGSISSWHGSYQQINVAGNCHYPSPGAVQCNLYIDGEEAGIYRLTI